MARLFSVARMLVSRLQRITVDSDPAAFPVYQAYVDKQQQETRSEVGIWWDLNYAHDALAKNGVHKKKYWLRDLK